MNIITIDFETAYGGDLGFAKQTTEEYIRDPRFEVIGVAVQVNDGEPVWFSAR
jgi:DNA polymerase